MRKTLKFLIIFCFSFVIISFLTNCGFKKNDKYTIVCTIYPQYDWTINILGEHKGKFEVKYLLSGGVDLHNYQPSVSDITAIGFCDLFIYVGGESDSWVNDALKNATNKNITSIALTDNVSTENERIVDGMENNNHHEHDEHDHNHVDEHVWTSLKKTIVLVEVIALAIAEVDEENTNDYMNNANAYKQKLIVLDNEYQETVNTGTKNAILFGDRFPFRYLADDYSLTYYAAFSGCSAESEASFETLKFLIGKVNELNLKVILTLETSDGSIARTIQKSTNSKDQNILVMHSLQSVSNSDIEAGFSYLSAMTNNLEMLKQALA